MWDVWAQVQSTTFRMRDSKSWTIQWEKVTVSSKRIISSRSKLCHRATKKIYWVNSTGTRKWVLATVKRLWEVVVKQTLKYQGRVIITVITLIPWGTSHQVQRGTPATYLHSVINTISGIKLSIMVKSNIFMEERARAPELMPIITTLSQSQLRDILWIHEA
jgi:hypothetical protein